MAAALGIDGVSFDHEEVHSGTDLSGYDLVVLAALAGSTPREKQSLLSHLAAAMAPGALLLARSARHLRTLLYSPINLDALAGFDVLSVLHPVHPFHEVINSVILARKPRHRLGRRRGTAGAPASAAARHGSSAPGPAATSNPTNCWAIAPAWVSSGSTTAPTTTPLTRATMRAAMASGSTQVGTNPTACWLAISSANNRRRSRERFRTSAPSPDCSVSGWAGGGRGERAGCDAVEGAPAWWERVSLGPSRSCGLSGLVGSAGGRR